MHKVLRKVINYCKDIRNYKYTYQEFQCETQGLEPMVN